MNSLKNNITREEIEQLPLEFFRGNIHLYDENSTDFSALEKLNNSAVVGFDTETRPSFKKGMSNQNRVALIQMATETDAFIFRIHRSGIPEEVLQILASDKIKKIGVAVRDDVLALRKIANFVPDGFIDLQDYSASFLIESNGLRKLAAIVLGCRISKTQQLSNWENELLTEAQMLYAATDAWACFMIYSRLQKIIISNADDTAGN